MASMRETCSICTKEFDVQFRYQMEEKNGGFAFYCSQNCLETSQRGDGDSQQVTCNCCGKRFVVELVSQVLYVGGKRKYACGMDCRHQLSAEARGGSPQRPASAVKSSQPRRVSPARVPSAPSPATRPKARPLATRAPKRIAIFNHKGGTGKTTTSVSVAAGLAAQGKRVLLIDTDAQGNVSVSLGVKPERTLYHVLVMGLRPEEAVEQVRPGLDLIPSNETLAAAELYLAGRQNRDRVLSGKLGKFAANYDYVVVDCSPSLSLLNQNALCLVDSVLVPVACDYLSLVGMRQVIKTVKNVNQLLHHNVKIWGILPTFFDTRAKICHEAVETLREHFGERCLNPIRQAIKVKEAPSQGQTIFEYAKNSSAARDYAALVEKIIGVSAAEAARTVQMSA